MLSTVFWSEKRISEEAEKCELHENSVLFNGVCCIGWTSWMDQQKFQAIIDWLAPSAWGDV